MDPRRTRTVSILDRGLSKGKTEVNLSTFAFLFSEIIQYSHNRVQSVHELNTKLAELGRFVGFRMVDLLFVREKNSRRETRLIGMLMFVKTVLWKSLFGKEADNLEQQRDNENTYYIIEKEPIINKFISVPKELKSNLNCASFAAGIVEAALEACNFPAKVTAHWHKGTTLIIKFQDSVIIRDKMLDPR